MRLAAALGGEVVNADSMQLYVGMDVGTDKLDPVERAGIPHHLLDIWPVTRAANVSDYQRLARETVDRLLAVGRTPVLVGGSGLYVRAVLDDLEFPGTDPVLRARLEAELDAEGAAALHARLGQRDPAAAAAILPSNGRRLVRALEVIEMTGQPFSARLPAYRYRYDAVQIGLALEDATLDERIQARVERMWGRGFVDEVRRLAAAGLPEGRTASRALGYHQVLEHLSGRLGEAEARARTVAATRRFARRQRSWFRRDPRVHWLPADRPDLPEQALARAAAPADRAEAVDQIP